MNKNKNAVNPMSSNNRIGGIFLTKKVKISFLLLVWGIVFLQLYVNHKDNEKLMNMQEEKNAEQIVEGEDMVCPQ